MKKFLCIIMALLAISPAVMAAASSPKPIEVINEKNAPKPFTKGKPDFSCSFATDYVGSDIPRRFFIELELPKADYPELEVAYDKNKVKMLDKRSLETNFLPNGKKAGKPRQVRRFYFETIAGNSGKTEISFANANGVVVVPFVIWNYEDLRSPKIVKNLELPRRYPMNGRIEELKPQVVRPKLGRDTPKKFTAEKRATNKDAYDTGAYTLEEIWQLAPDGGMSPRVQTGEPDPIHGNEVFKVGGAFYPYKQLVGAPGNVNEWFLISPVDGRKIPDNDLAKGDYSSGKWIDDGFNGIEIDGQLRKYVGQLNWFRGANVYGMAERLADNYTRTGDPKYLSRALVMLSRIAVEHNYLSSMPHHRKTHFNYDWQMRLIDAVPMTVLGNCGFYNHGCIQPGLTAQAIRAYEKVFPFLADDKEIIPFLQQKGFPVQNTAELQRFIEENLFHTHIQITLDGMCNTNYPAPQQEFLNMVGILNYPGPELMNIVTEGDSTYFINGIVKPILYNFCRDGVNSESPSGYNTGKYASVLDLFNRYEKIIKNNPKAFPPEKYLNVGVTPKLALAMESMIEHHPTASTKLTLGDAGSTITYNETPHGKINFYGDEKSETFAAIYTRYPNAKIAWALVNSNWKVPKNYPYTLEQLKKHAETLPIDWRLRSRLLPGLGIALNRSGKGDNERAIITVYGNVYGGHANDSTMGLFLDGFRSRLITQWGYPLNWDGWYRCWVTQNTGRHYPLTQNGKAESKSEVVYLLGANEINLDAGPLHVTDSFADLVLDKYIANGRKEVPIPRYEVLEDGWQRRINLLVDVSESDFYVLDLYRMFGGKEHWRSMQSLDGAVSTENLNLKKQEKGTLAGESVTYDQKSWWDKNGNYGSSMLRPLSLLENVEKATAPATPWSVIWDINNSRGLKMKLTGILTPNAEINLADGRDPQSAHNIVRRFVMTHHKSQDGKPFSSETFNMIQVYRGNPAVQSVKSLAVTGKDERTFVPVGAEVKLVNRTDYFILSTTETLKNMKLPDGKVMELRGRIGYVAMDNAGKIVDMQLIGGTALSCGNQKISHQVGTYRGKIVKTDYAKNSFEISSAVANVAELVGKQLYVTRGGVKIGLEVQEAVNTGSVTIVRVNCDPLLFIGTSRKFADNYLGYRGQLNYGPSWANDVAGLGSLRTYHYGTIVGKSGTNYTVNTVRNGGVNLMPDKKVKTDATTLEKDFPVGSELKVYDYGVGNLVEIPFNSALH